VLQLFIGLIIGGNIGFFICALCSISSGKSERFESNSPARKSGDLKDDK